jgi:hypothetical protein
MSQAANKLVEVGVVLQGGGALGAYENRWRVPDAPQPIPARS